MLWVRRAGWIALLWCLGVAAVGVLAVALRSVLL